MPFVKRNASGNIIAIQHELSEGVEEELETSAPEIALFLYGSEGSLEARQTLMALDQKMARVLEDLIDLMVRKNQIVMTELPQAAQEKLMSRRSVRGELSNAIGLVEEDDIL